ncbi:MAG: hypothetical protein JO032_00400 [Alphaproteobacteria bacterium]|nr:hypothetical protein [Alphaproteobacteria bacterium]MBV9551225.1 hypothetical protein [Alphaproteobacteria bacterium]
MLGIAVLPALARLGYVAYVLSVPRYSAVALFEKAGFNLRLDFFRTGTDARQSGRYLSVITTAAYRTFNIPGWDWAHKARTSIYRIDENHVAVLSPMGNDYKITLKPFDYAPVVSDTGKGWQYLGAFDFAFAPGGPPHLEFFDQQLPECIPMGTEASPRAAALPRAEARRESCPSPDYHSAASY